MSNNFRGVSKENLTILDELSDINQKIIYCSELLAKKLSTNSDPKILEILKILDNASNRLTDQVVSLRDKLDE